MSEQDRRLRDQLAKATRDATRLRSEIDKSGDRKAIERAAKIDAAVPRAVRRVQSRLDRTREQRIATAITAEEQRTQPQPEPRPRAESGNRRSALGMTPKEKDASEDRVRHNIELQDGKALLEARASIDALRTAKLEVTAQAVERRARNRDGMTDKDRRAANRARFHEALKDRDRERD